MPFEPAKVAYVRPADTRPQYDAVTPGRGCREPQKTRLGTQYRYAGSLVTKLWEFSGDRAAARSPIHPTYQIPQGLRRACAGIWTETLRRILPYGPSLALIVDGECYG